MSGYKPSKKVYNLTFTDYPGMMITANGASLGKMLDMGRMQVPLDAPQEDQMKVFTFFAKRIVTWNIEHPDMDDEDTNEDGTCRLCGSAPGLILPTTAEAMLCLEPEFIMSIIMGWMAAVSRVSGPKDLSTNNGDANTLMMEQLKNQLGQMQSPLTSPTLKQFSE